MPLSSSVASSGIVVGVISGFWEAAGAVSAGVVGITFDS